MAEKTEFRRYLINIDSISTQQLFTDCVVIGSGIAALRAAIEAGVNYIDLLYVETDYWDTFGPLYRAYRDKLILAAHWGGGPRYDLDFCQHTFATRLTL